MKVFKYFLTLIIIMGFMISCSGSSGSGDNIDHDESQNTPGASLDAAGFQDAYPIELQIQMPSGDFVPAYDGQYIDPGMKHFNVYVRGDSEAIDHVLLSDGGTYQVEALKQDDAYRADFNISSNRMYSSVLIQVISKNRRASKEKIVFKTVKENSGDVLIADGIDILLSNDLLQKNRAMLAPALDSYIHVAFDCIRTRNADIVNSLTYGDNNPDTIDIVVTDFEAVHDATCPSAVLHLGFTIYGVTLSAVTIYGNDLITTTDNTLDVDMLIAVSDQRNDGTRGLVFKFSTPPLVSFQNDFFMRTVFEEKIADGLVIIERSPLAASLQDLFKTIGDAIPLNIVVNDRRVDLRALFDRQNFDLSQYLYIDLYGVPANTSSQVPSLRAGVFVDDQYVQKEIPNPAPKTNPDFNRIIIDLCQKIADKAFENIKQEYDGLINTLAYGDGNPQTPDITINMLSIQAADYPDTKTIRVNFTIKDVDLIALRLFGLPLINTRNNDLTIDAIFQVTYSSNMGGHLFDLSVEDVMGVSFKNYFVGQRVIEALAKDTLKNLDNISTNIDNIIADLDVEIDLGACTEGFEFPDVSTVYSPYNGNPALPEGYNFRFSLSQDTINAALAKLFTKDFEWDIYELLNPILGQDFIGFDRDRNNEQKTIMRFSVPPVLDFRSSQIKIEVDDLLIEYRVNGTPQWAASVDLDLICDVRIINGDTLGIFIRSVPENCHFHIMRDNAGNLGLLDHSNLVNDIVDHLPQLIGGGANDPFFTIRLDSFKPFLVFDYLVDPPIAISAGNGCLYVDAEAMRMDFSALINCFF